MEAWIILRRLREDKRPKNFGKNSNEWQETVKVLSRAIPFVGRIITNGKMYAGKIKKLAMKKTNLNLPSSALIKTAEPIAVQRPAGKRYPWKI